jgi:hypothetical protein
VLRSEVDGDRLIDAVCHRLDGPPIAVADDGTERRFHLQEVAHRAQKGRKTIKRFKPAELIFHFSLLAHQNSVVTSVPKTEMGLWSSIDDEARSRPRTADCAS